MQKLNSAQRKFLSDFLNGLAIAWFSAGTISPLFTAWENLLKLSLQIIGSVAISTTLLILGVKNLQDN